MSRKLFAFVLSIVLVWVGLTAQGQMVLVTSLSDAAVSAPCVVPATCGIDEEPADGQPASESLSKVHAEPLADLTGLVAEHDAPRSPALSMARPNGPAMVSGHPPYLDGPRRPPRQANVIA